MSKKQVCEVCGHAKPLIELPNIQACKECLKRNKQEVERWRTLETHPEYDPTENNHEMP